MSIEITAEQSKLFKMALESSTTLDMQNLSTQTGVDLPMVMGSMTFAQDQGWIKITEQSREELIAQEGAREAINKGLPERQFLDVLHQESGSMPMKMVASKSQELGIKVNDIIKWGTMKEWFEKDKGNLSLGKQAEQALQEKADDEKALALVVEKERLFIDELPEEINPDYVKRFLKKRSDLVKCKERTLRFVEVTKKGKKEIPSLSVKAEEKNILSSEDIVSGKWKEIKLRSYDVTLAAEPKKTVKNHPLQKIIQETRRTFLEMGFTELVSSHLETGFWDFDALFQPQDHPSRDMQDTFYMKRPHEGDLPSKNIVEKVKKTHEDGGDSGSTGWGYKWQTKEAKRMILRTHTTATTVHYLAQNPNPPSKVFSVGRVFRNETISFKHLPEFHQVDGIIVDSEASFRNLLGTIQAFYNKMGFKKVKFKPSFFPYTEPSAEVFVWMEQKNCWIELGGSGIFRPEVTIPLGCNVPVLAWGLGLERLAMLRYGVSDIRTLYESDLDWLQEVRLCQ